MLSFHGESAIQTDFERTLSFSKFSLILSQKSNGRCLDESIIVITLRNALWQQDLKIRAFHFPNFYLDGSYARKAVNKNQNYSVDKQNTMEYSFGNKIK